MLELLSWVLTSLANIRSHMIFWNIWLNSEIKRRTEGVELRKIKSDLYESIHFSIVEPVCAESLCRKWEILRKFHRGHENEVGGFLRWPIRVTRHHFTTHFELLSAHFKSCTTHFEIFDLHNTFAPGPQVLAEKMKRLPSSSSFFQRHLLFNVWRVFESFV